MAGWGLTDAFHLSGSLIDFLQPFFADDPPTSIVLQNVTYDLVGITTSGASSVIADRVSAENNTSATNSFTLANSYSVSQTLDFNITDGIKVLSINHYMTHLTDIPP
jgi:hypothetical protein